jgi:uncharacterized protein YdhG (YjbR/CyaY superfamily)
MSDKEKVAEFMEKLKHPLKEEIEAVRKIIKSADKRIKERIKWNAPSYYYLEDMVTFNPRNHKAVHLVFHHKLIVKIESPILVGDYKDRRMAYFKDINEVKSNKAALQWIMAELVKKINKQLIKK